MPAEEPNERPKEVKKDDVMNPILVLRSSLRASHRSSELALCMSA